MNPLLLLVAAAMLSLVAPGLTMAQPITETQKVIDMASTYFVVCDGGDSPDSYLKSLLLQQCDYNIKFLKGLCESTNNQYEYCKDIKMDKYLILRGQYDAFKPKDVWCDHFIDKCIELAEAAKASAIDQFGEDEADNLVQIYDEKIEELEDKKEAAAQGEDTDNDD